MKKLLKFHMLIGVAVLCVASTQTRAQTIPSSTEVPVSLVLTLQGQHGAGISGLNSGNLIVTAGRDRAKITDVLPLQDARAGLELFIMMDRAREISYGTQVKDLAHFILAQPPTTKIGIAYMDMQGPTIVQDLTTDHSRAAQAVTTPLGSLANGRSPYTSLTQLIDKWAPSNGGREVLMISNGEDATFGDVAPDRKNPYLDAAVENAQRAGIVVFTIATGNESVRLAENEPPIIPPGKNTLPNIGPRGPALGKFYLGQIAEGTGGKSYYYKSSAPVSFAPYLEDLTQRLASQYLVRFLATSGKKPGLQSIKVRSELSHTEVVTARNVYIPARTAGDK